MNMDGVLMLRRENIEKSLVFKTSVRIMLIVGVLLAVLILSNIYSLRVVTNNMLTSSQNTAAIYINNIENSTGSATKDLNEISVKYLDDIVNYSKLGSLEKYLAANRLREVLLTKTVSNENLDGLFIVQPEQDLFLSQYSNRVTSAEKLNLNFYLNTKSYYQNNQSNNAWNLLLLEKTYFLIKAYSVSGIVVGVMIKPDTLMSFIRRSSVKNSSQYVITDKNGNILSVSSQTQYFKDSHTLPNSDPFIENFNRRYLMITADIPSFQGRLSSIIKNENVFFGLGLIQWIILFLSIASIFIIPYVFYYLFRGIIRPVQALVAATKEVEAGNWNFRLPRDNTPSEFITLNNSFESMVKEIKTLKIDSYEEKIERQKAELKYLQMQIKPHFYLNAITTISSLTHQNRGEEIRKFIDLLSRHLRYMFKGGLVKVAAREEIEHSKNYILLMEIKYPNNIFYLTDIDPEVENCLLPQFLVQTFVENTFRHALTIGKMLSVFIKAEKYRRAETDFVRIMIEDNGDGFPTEIIEAVNAPEGGTHTEGKRIGITNIKKTMRLLYKRNDLLKISNCEPKGARVEILIPLDAEEINENTVSG